MKCPKCNSDECIEQEHNNNKNYTCIGCGYATTSACKVKNLEFQADLIQMSKEQKAMMWIDNTTKLYWFPLYFNIPKVGVLIPEGTLSDVSWIYMPMINLTDQERKKSNGKVEKPDTVRKKTFTSDNIKEALLLLKIIS